MVDASPHASTEMTTQELLKLCDEIIDCERHCEQYLNSETDVLPKWYRNMGPDRIAPLARWARTRIQSEATELSGRCRIEAASKDGSVREVLRNVLRSEAEKESAGDIFDAALKKSVKIVDEAPSALPEVEEIRKRHEDLVLEWIRDHTSVAAKMSWQPKQTDSLIGALMALIEGDAE